MKYIQYKTVYNIQFTFIQPRVVQLLQEPFPFPKPAGKSTLFPASHALLLRLDLLLLFGMPKQFLGYALGQPFFKSRLLTILNIPIRLQMCGSISFTKIRVRVSGMIQQIPLL